MVIELLDPRVILDAPLALASDGLLLSGPTSLERREPALFGDAAPAASPPSDASGAPTPAPIPQPLDPNDDPLSPVGDPPRGQKVAPMSTADCGSCITYSVSVINISGVDEADPSQTGLFRFSAAASCSSGAPSSITVGYTFDGSTATQNVDYNGPITTGTVDIPLVNGSGSKDVTYSVLDDAADEPIEYVKVNITPTSEIIPVHPYESAMGPVYDNDIEWREADPIQGTISTSNGSDPAVPINGTLGLTVDASDRDQYKEDGVWTDYWDDVTSGATATDYHITWTASEGKFIQDGLVVDTAYGTGATYLAPDYAEGQDVRTVTITATVDDFNRGADVDGFDDNALQVQQAARVWQIKLTVNQGPGNVSGAYDGPPIAASDGAGRLGWIAPGNPPGTEAYAVMTEIKGTVPIPGLATGYDWVQQQKGTAEFFRNGQWRGDSNNIDWAPDGPFQYVDLDVRHPDGPGGQDSGIFLYDDPGFYVGPNNDGGIANGNTKARMDKQFKTSATLGGGRISNEVTWGFSMNLEVQGGAWVPTHHLP